MARRLYYQDSYGRTHRARSAERSRGLPGGLAAKFLIAWPSSSCSRSSSTDTPQRPPRPVPEQALRAAIG